MFMVPPPEGKSVPEAISDIKWPAGSALLRRSPDARSTHRKSRCRLDVGNRERASEKERKAIARTP
jgi:hypothetical protein